MAQEPILGLPYFIEAVPVAYLTWWTYRFVRQDKAETREKIAQSFQLILWFQLFAGIISFFVCLTAFSAIYSDPELREIVKKEAIEDLKNSALNDENLEKEIKELSEGLDELSKLDK